MSTLEEVKVYTLSQLKGALELVGMFSACTIDQETLYATYLDLLSVMDGKADSAEPEYMRLLKHCGFWASCRASTPFLSRGIDEDDMRDSLAVVYAQISHSLGYVSFDRAIGSEECESMRQWCVDEMQHENWHESDIIERFGQPSFSTKGSHRKGLLYGTGERKEWVGFLFSNQWEKGEGDDTPKLVWGDRPILGYAFMPGDKPCSCKIVWTKYSREKKGIPGLQR